jgi:hypothetical protein
MSDPTNRAIHASLGDLIGQLVTLQSQRHASLRCTNSDLLRGLDAEIRAKGKEIEVLLRLSLAQQ